MKKISKKILNKLKRTQALESFLNFAQPKTQMPNNKDFNKNSISSYQYWGKLGVLLFLFTFGFIQSQIYTAEENIIYVSGGATISTTESHIKPKTEGKQYNTQSLYTSDDALIYDPTNAIVVEKNASKAHKKSTEFHKEIADAKKEKVEKYIQTTKKSKIDSFLYSKNSKEKDNSLGSDSQTFVVTPTHNTSLKAITSQKFFYIIANIRDVKTSSFYGDRFYVYDGLNRYYCVRPPPSSEC